MSYAQLSLQSPRNAKSLAARVVRSTKISEAAALRLHHYRNGFTIRYRNCCPSGAYRLRIGKLCPWWAFPRCKAVSYAQWEALRLRINERRAS